MLCRTQWNGKGMKTVNVTREYLGDIKCVIILFIETVIIIE